MTVQILDIAGEKMAVLPVADYRRLLEAAEDQEDLQATVVAEFSVAVIVVLKVQRENRQAVVDQLRAEIGRASWRERV